MVRHSTRKRAARRLQAEQGLPYSVARRESNPSFVSALQDTLHHSYIGSVAAHWADCGIPIIGWRAGGSAEDRWSGIWCDESFHDEHGCVFHQLYWSNRVYSPSDRSGWEVHLIPPVRGQQESTSPAQSRRPRTTCLRPISVTTPFGPQNFQHRRGLCSAFLPDLPRVGAVFARRTASHVTPTAVRQQDRTAGRHDSVLPHRSV